MIVYTQSDAGALAPAQGWPRNRAIDRDRRAHPSGEVRGHVADGQIEVCSAEQCRRTGAGRADIRGKESRRKKPQRASPRARAQTLDKAASADIHRGVARTTFHSLHPSKWEPQRWTIQRFWRSRVWPKTLRRAAKPWRIAPLVEARAKDRPKRGATTVTSFPKPFSH